MEPNKRHYDAYYEMAVSCPHCGMEHHMKAVPNAVKSDDLYDKLYTQETTFSMAYYSVAICPCGHTIAAHVHVATSADNKYLKFMEKMGRIKHQGWIK